MTPTADRRPYGHSFSQWEPRRYWSSLPSPPVERRFSSLAPVGFDLVELDTLRHSRRPRQNGFASEKISTAYARVDDSNIGFSAILRPQRRLLRGTYRGSQEVVRFGNAPIG